MRPAFLCLERWILFGAVPARNSREQLAVLLGRGGRLLEAAERVQANHARAGEADQRRAIDFGEDRAGVGRDVRPSALHMVHDNDSRQTGPFVIPSFRSPIIPLAPRPSPLPLVAQMAGRRPPAAVPAAH